MAISTFVSRLGVYYKRHGFGATIRRGVGGTKRALFANRAVLFYCDLCRLPSPAEDPPKALRVERKRAYAEIEAEDLRQIIDLWNPKVAGQRMAERFSKGSSLWLIKFNDRLAGYGWTLQGCTIAPYYFPLTEHDVQFFDFHVLAKYRGRAIDWFLMTHIMQQLAREGAVRAFAEAGEWNQASLASIASTSFRRVCTVRQTTLWGRTIVFWDPESAMNQEIAGQVERSGGTADAARMSATRK